MFKVTKQHFLLIIAVFFIGMVPVSNTGTIQYINDKTLTIEAVEVEKRLIDFEEEISIDTLYGHLSGKGDPVFFSRNVVTSVCFDGKCRLLDVIVYWNPTGRYLGFEMPENEYLSKHDHEPFTEEEYLRLNALLADPFLPLGGFSYNEIVMEGAKDVNSESQYDDEEIDGVSSATSKFILDYVVEGAAYTTYKLWHLIYGPTSAVIKQWTTGNFDSDYIGLLLESENLSDVLWTLEQLEGKLDQYPEISPLIFEFINSNEYSLSEKAIQTINPQNLASETFQSNLVALFPQMDSGRKKWILDLFKKAPIVHPNTVTFFNEVIIDLEVPLTVILLEVYQKQELFDANSLGKVRALSKSDNNYLAQKAKRFLETVPK
ncbi:hypothetical protein [Cyclobacterium qasimii]|uniref:Uncharacterized protein n=2 Tax=Cyclobacterium qasimii TaxID=1350429 RepID=S7VAM6_9BACT|nr:hypothetical protein [Cyclobacterium qasimii]EPR67026.1 hypothetical protein ADICYQ_3896 [Cyclobacterium qasimii M12-11B]GEO19754.1 hypothetical protein CQA01_02880 [Cyclobacterium qasimii]